MAREHQEETILSIIYSDHEQGYMIDLYNSTADFENGDDSIDGACCTGDYDDALAWGAEILAGAKPQLTKEEQSLIYNALECYKEIHGSDMGNPDAYNGKIDAEIEALQTKLQQS